MVVEKRLMTAEELFRLPDDGYLYELLDGELIQMTPPGGEHGKVTIRVGHHLLVHVDKLGLGEVLGGDPGIFLRRNPGSGPRAGCLLHCP